MFFNGDNIYQRLLMLLITKRVDAVLDDKAFIQYQLQGLNPVKKQSALPAIISAGSLSKEQHVVAYSPKHLEKPQLLMEIIDPFVTDLYETGNTKEYLSRYGID